MASVAHGTGAHKHGSVIDPHPVLGPSLPCSSTCPVKSGSLLAGLLRAHAALCCQDESLACMLGGKSGGDPAGAAGMQAALVARYHLASCLRCYVEAAQPWQVRALLGMECLHVAAQCRPRPASAHALACRKVAVAHWSTGPGS